MTEQRKKIGCLNIGLAVLLGVMLLIVIGSFLGGGDDAGTSGDLPDNVVIETVTAPALFEAFERNEVAAKARFDGKPVRVTGSVRSIELDLMDNPQIRLIARGDYDNVIAGFGKDEAAATAALSRGQEVRVLCQKVSEVIGTPVLRDCVID